jgi:anti-sigma factor RsiW
MTILHRNDGPLDDRLIDRLVDGELSQADRRAALARLEAEPDGWRRCALAFLEGQSWRESLEPLTASGREPVADRSLGQARRLAFSNLRTLTAVAAGILTAFALGWAAHHEFSAGRNRAPLANVETPGPTSTAKSLQPVSAEVPADSLTAVEPPDSMPIPDAVVRAFERRGVRVERSQRLVSLELKDGRRLPVPVDEVRLRYVGNRTY